MVRGAARDAGGTGAGPFRALPGRPRAASPPGRRCARCGHRDEPRQLGRGRRRGRRCRGRGGARDRDRDGLRRHPAARAPRPGGARDGVLFHQQRRRRGAPRAAARPAPGADRGLGRAPRERHASLSGARSLHPLCLDPSVPLVSRDRRRGRAWRGEHLQRPAPAGLAARPIRRRSVGGGGRRDRRVAARPTPRVRRVRLAQRRPARRLHARAGRHGAVDYEAAGARRPGARGGGARRRLPARPHRGRRVRSRARARLTGGIMSLRLAAQVLALKTKHPFVIARGGGDDYRVVWVRLTDSDGVEGWGEADPAKYYGETADTVLEILQLLEPHLPKDAFDLEAAEARFARVVPKNGAARAALSAALHDLVGKRLGQPLWRLWGLDPAKAPRSSFTIGIDTAERIRLKVAEASAYPILKVKLGTDRDEEILRTIRDATDKPLRVDANAGWTRERAIEMLPVLKAYGVEFVEQPLPPEDLEGIAALRRRGVLPDRKSTRLNSSH